MTVFYSQKARLRAKWNRQKNRADREADQFIDRALRKAKKAAGWKRLEAGSLEDKREEIEMMQNLRADIESSYRRKDRSRAMRRINAKIEAKIASIAKIELGVITGLNTPAGDYIKPSQRSVTELADKLEEVEERLDYAGK